MGKDMKNITPLILITILLTGCSSGNQRPAPVSESKNTTIVSQKTIKPTAIKKIKPKAIAQQKQKLEPLSQSRRNSLLNHYKEWRGVSYKHGGLSKRGIDCSGFVYITFKKLFNTNIPRSTKLLASTGEHINQSQLSPGDIILYKTTRTVRHAGIYMGNNKFLHASKSKGVMISSMDLDYWRDRYWQARRVL